MRISHSQDRYGMYSSILSIKVRIKAEPNLLANATSYRDTLDHNPASTEQKVNKNSREIPTKFFRVRHDDITEKNVSNLCNPFTFYPLCTNRTSP